MSCGPLVGKPIAQGGKEGEVVASASKEVGSQVHVGHAHAFHPHPLGGFAAVVVGDFNLAQSRRQAIHLDAGRFKGAGRPCGGGHALATSHFGHALHGGFFAVRRQCHRHVDGCWLLDEVFRLEGLATESRRQRVSARQQRADGRIVRGESKRTCPRPIDRIGTHVGVGVNGAVRVEGRFQIARDVLNACAQGPRLRRRRDNADFEGAGFSVVPVDLQQQLFPSFQTRRQQGASVCAQPTTVVVVGIQQLKRAEIRAIVRSPQGELRVERRFHVAGRDFKHPSIGRHRPRQPHGVAQTRFTPSAKRAASQSGRRGFVRRHRCVARAADPAGAVGINGLCQTG